MNDLTVFQNPEFGELRTAERNGETWFCLADVCRPLGLRAKDCKLRLKKDGVDTIALTDSVGRMQGMLFVNEGNLYRAIFQSRKPEADRFTDWVTEEVLPSIRKTGRYENKPMTMAENLAAQAQLLVEQEKRIARIEQRVETGERRRDYMALTKLDAIAVDKGLRVAFEGLVARETARAAQKGEIAKRL